MPLSNRLDMMYERFIKDMLLEKLCSPRFKPGGFVWSKQNGFGSWLHLFIWMFLFVPLLFSHWVCYSCFVFYLWHRKYMWAYCQMYFEWVYVSKTLRVLSLGDNKYPMCSCFYICTIVFLKLCYGHKINWKQYPYYILFYQNRSILTLFLIS